MESSQRPSSSGFPHGLHRPALRLPQRHVRVYLQNGVFMVLQVSGELRRDGLVVRPEADVHAYVVAELADGAVGAAAGALMPEPDWFRPEWR